MHASSFPDAWHRWHGEDVTIWPRIDWRTRRTSPAPPQVSQRVAVVPGLAPLPEHVVHET